MELAIISVSLLFLSCFIIGLSLYLVILSNRNNEKDELIETIINENFKLKEQISDMTREGELLTSELSALNDYYDLAHATISQITDKYSLLETTSINSMLKHRYYGDDPVVQSFMKGVMEFQRDMSSAVITYNSKAGEILRETEN